MAFRAAVAEGGHSHPASRKRSLNQKAILKMRPQIKSAIALGLVLIFVGCRDKTVQPNGVYDIKGTVVTLDTAKKAVELDHEEIPGIMAAMDMAYAVADPKLLAGLKLGDTVLGKLKVESGNYTITSLAKH